MMPAQHRARPRPAWPPRQRLTLCWFALVTALSLPITLLAEPTLDDPVVTAAAEAGPDDRAEVTRRLEMLQRFQHLSDQVWTGLESSRRFPVTVLPADTTGDSSARATADRRRRSAGGWSPYAGPFAWPEASHLLRRALVGPRLGEVNRAVNAGLAPTLDALFAARPMPADPGPWVREPLPDLDGWSDASIDSLSRLYFSRQDSLRLWWSNRFIDDDPGLRETMTLFWHDHFATRSDKVWIPSAVYGQNEKLRAYALGNFRDLLRAIALDPAMLVWLDGNENQAGNVNENFARELLELFTMGVGHYTQEEIREAARAFTGYVCWDGINVHFYEDWHDFGPKTFFGQTGDFGPDEIIDIVLEQPATAEFIVRKLYRYFLDEVPDEPLVQELAAEFRDGDYAIAPVLRRMLASSEFFDANHVGCIYTDGVERTFGLARSFDLPPFVYTDFEAPHAHWAFWSMWTLGEVLMEPPNVGGWPGDRSWINSHTLAFRRFYAATLIDGRHYDEELGRRLDPVALARQCPQPNDPDALVTALSVFFCGVPPTAAVHERLYQELLSGMSADEWSIDHPDAPEHLDRFFRLLVKLPEFQLK